MAVPNYRVRLFLSVDLTGSTAYKHRNKNSLEWIKAFQLFYGRFPGLLSDHYEKLCQTRKAVTPEEQGSGHPKLWKTVGDEILFCCRLTSLCHLGACIDAFVEALKDFGALVRGFELNTKGNAWVASFPSPNCSIMPVRAANVLNGDALNGTSDLPTEENEAKVDLDPSLFDFLGKGIDAGFRISKNSAIDTLTISPGLGILLAQASGSRRITGFNREIRLAEMQVFKGVAESSPYPVLTIDTSRDSRHEELLKRQRNLLGQPLPPKDDELEEYLKGYLDYYEIEVPKVKNTFAEQGFTPPDFYQAYCDNWHREAARLEAENQRIVDASTASGDENGGAVGDEAELKGIVESLPPVG